MIPQTSDLLLRWDASRPRSQQTEMGMSALGGCRRAAGYRLAGVEPDSNGQSMPAVLGSAIHEVAAGAARKQHPTAMTETLEVKFAGLVGHPDVVAEPVVRDLKTTGRSSTLEAWRIQGPPRKHLWQVSMYAAALIVAGYHISVLQLDYLARDSGKGFMWEGPFQMGPVREAMAWLKSVRETELDFLARDYRPGSPQCETCPFRRRCWEGHALPGRDLRTALYFDEPDAVTWVERLEDARARKRQAELDEADARGALDALRPNDRGTAEVEVPGLDDKVIKFSVSKPVKRLDTEQVRADYAAVDAEPPMTYGDPRITVSLANKPDE